MFEVTHGTNSEMQTIIVKTYILTSQLKTTMEILGYKQGMLFCATI